MTGQVDQPKLRCLVGQVQTFAEQYQLTARYFECNFKILVAPNQYGMIFPHAVNKSCKFPGITLKLLQQTTSIFAESIFNDELLTFYLNFWQALANSFEGKVTNLEDVLQKGSHLRERCNSEGRISIDGKLKTIQKRWSDLSDKISQKLQTVKDEISEWTSFNKDLDDKLNELRGYEISLCAQLIGVSDLPTLEKELADVKVFIDFE